MKKIYFVILLIFIFSSVAITTYAESNNEVSLNFNMLEERESITETLN
ncbi:MAG: hypothetical protein K0S55_1399, partial [Clostridia bacterium]|nr:hypothetical protein [Clostridia bacterium]